MGEVADTVVDLGIIVVSNAVNSRETWRRVAEEIGGGRKRKKERRKTNPRSNQQIGNIEIRKDLKNQFIREVC